MLWLQAQADLALPSDFAAAGAVNRLHDAFEAFMAAVYRHFKGSDTWVNFDAYPEKIRQTTKRRLTHDQVVTELNTLRVSAKHHGNWPRYQDVRALALRCTAFLEENCIQYFGVAFSDVRLSSFVEHEEARAFLAQAEDTMRDGDYVQTLAFLQAAFQTFIGDAAGERLPRGHTALLPAWSLPTRGDLERVFPEQRTRDLMVKLVSELEKTQELVQLQAIGVNPLERAVFDAITPGVHLSEAGTIIGQPYYQTGKSLLATPENGHWAMNYVLGAILRFQTIPAPFDAWGKYKLRVVADCPVVDGEGSQVGRLNAGAIIENAGLCLHFAIGDSWMWGEDAQRRFVRVTDCEIQETRRHAQLARDRKRAWFQDQARTDNEQGT